MTRLKNFFSLWQNWIGVLLVVFFVFVAVAAPLLSPPNDQTQGAFKRVGRASDQLPHPPNEDSILGTLPGQTDVFHALVWGTRDAMFFGLSVAIGAFLFGSIFGAISGYAGGTVNNFMMRISDAFLTFPVLAAVVFLQEIVATTIESMGGVYWFNNQFVGKQVYFQATPPPVVAFLLRVDPILISLILFSWMPSARIVNTIVITLKNTEFVQAARALGGNPLWIVRRHLLPNSVGPAIVLAARDVGSSVILQATITFIGLGGNSSWGTMLSIGRDWIIGASGKLFTFWWVYLPATLMVLFFGIAWNLLGDGINDVMSPESFVRVGGSSRRWWKNKRQDALAQNNQFIGEYETTAGRESIFAPDPILSVARDAVGHKDLESALHAYTHLIDRGRHTNDVIRDLAQIARKYPRESQVWQMLGDALMCNGEIEEARRAYARAKQVIR
jgi:peptide/nickel transport system permease protein